MIDHAEFMLRDPGLVENAPDETSCLLACMQMVMRTRNGAGVLSFADMNAILRRKAGEYSWEYALLTYLANNGFAVEFISAFDIRRLCAEKEAYLYEFYGPEGGEDQIMHSNLENVYADAAAFTKQSAIKLTTRTAQREDLMRLLETGHYVVPQINQRILQADPGVAAHVIMIYGYSARGVRAHNPGPPATCASEIDWDLFMKAWSSPREEARQIMGFKPKSV